MTFSKDLKTFSINFGEVCDKTFRGTSIAMSRGVIEKTPVDTGRARGNWFPSFDTPSTEITSKTSKLGAESIIRTVQKVSELTTDKSFFLTNNLPYIVVLENGSSTQAPNGMVAITVNEFQRVVNEQANKNRR